jgi:hypothetical protein
LYGWPSRTKMIYPKRDLFNVARSAIALKPQVLTYYYDRIVKPIGRKEKKGGVTGQHAPLVTGAEVAKRPTAQGWLSSRASAVSAA